MPAGFQTWTDDGYSQITDQDIFFTLSVKGTTSGATWLQEGNNSGYYDLVFSGYTMADAPMIALKGPGSWATLISSSPSSVTYRIFNVQISSAITYYFFTNRRPPLNASKCGIEVYDAGGGIVFGSDTLIARPMGVFSGELFGSSSYSGKPLTGRDVAHVPIKMGRYSYQQDTYGSFGSCGSGISLGYSISRSTGWQRSAIAASIGSVIDENRYMQTVISNVGCSSTPFPPPANSGGSLNFESLILDVTHY